MLSASVVTSSTRAGCSTSLVPPYSSPDYPTVLAFLTTGLRVSCLSFNDGGSRAMSVPIRDPSGLVFPINSYASVAGSTSLSPSVSGPLSRLPRGSFTLALDSCLYPTLGADYLLWATSTPSPIFARCSFSSRTSSYIYSFPSAFALVFISSKSGGDSFSFARVITVLFSLWCSIPFALLVRYKSNYSSMPCIAIVANTTL